MVDAAIRWPDVFVAGGNESGTYLFREDPSFGFQLATRVQALDSFILEGVTTTIPFLARVIRHPDFVSGQVDTRFLERESHLLRPES